MSFRISCFHFFTVFFLACCEFGRQCQCRWLLGKTRFYNYQLFMEWDGRLCVLAHSFNFHLKLIMKNMQNCINILQILWVH